MTERPILFSGPLVRAILAGQKTETRRPVLPSPGRQREWLRQSTLTASPGGHAAIVGGALGWQFRHPKAGQRYAGVDVPETDPLGWVRCPYGMPGDRLWVREAHCLVDGPAWSGLPCVSNPNGPEVAYYREGFDRVAPRWRPSIHMPRWASRILLEVTSVRVERVRDITEAGARAEGVQKWVNGEGFVSNLDPLSTHGRYRDGFAMTWGDIYADKPGLAWRDNPWVWVVGFQVVEP